jgi:hypothetical protein
MANNFDLILVWRTTLGYLTYVGANGNCSDGNRNCVNKIKITKKRRDETTRSLRERKKFSDRSGSQRKEENNR